MREHSAPITAVLVDGGVDYPRRLLSGLRSGLQAAGWRLAVVHSWPDGRHDADLLVRAMNTGQLSGLVVTPQRDDVLSTTVMRAAHESGAQVVTVGSAPSQALSVHAENGELMDALLDHVFTEHEARRPVLLQGNTGSFDAGQRHDSFNSAVRRHAVADRHVRILPAGFHREPAFRALSRCLREGFQPDLVVAANDEAALGALEALAMAGLSVPHDVMVTGFDNSPASALVGLTSIDQNLEEQGRAAAEALLHNRPALAAVGGRLMLRESTRDRGTVRSVLATPARNRLGMVYDLHRTLMGCRSVNEVVDELAPRLPRLGIKRFALAIRIRASCGAPQAQIVLLSADGVRLDPIGSSVPEHELLLEDVGGNFPEGASFRTLVGSSIVHGVMLHDIEEDEETRLVTAALQTALSQVIDSIAKEAELRRQAEALRAHAANLEDLVVARTVALEKEVEIRAATEARLKRLNLELTKVSLVDELTGLANRRALDRALAHAVHGAAEHPVGLVLMDLDEFKSYNDHYGHVGGDVCLTLVARAVRGCLRRSTDLAARYGGEELALVLPGADEALTASVANAAVTAVRSLGLEHSLSAHGVVTMSAGWSVVRRSGEASVDQLKTSADTALYKAKSNGRNGVVGPEDEVPVATDRHIVEFPRPVPLGHPVASMKGFDKL